MAKPSKNPSGNKIVVTLRTDLVDGVRKRSAEMEQNYSQFVNLCVEGCLSAMEDSSLGGTTIPIVAINRKLNGKTLLTSQSFRNLIGIVAPEFQQLEEDIAEIWIDLINKHEGPLTNDILSGYRRLAIEMNKERIAHRRKVAKIKKGQEF